MIERPSNLYTRTGDNGTTSLLGRKRVFKDVLRVHCIGEVDELNCAIGVVCATCDDEQMCHFLSEVQSLLFEVGAELAQPPNARLVRAHTARVEQFIDRLNESVPPSGGFILPSGTPTAAHCHLARAICRRAERSLFRLSRTEYVNSASLQFMNRLSDLLFVVARTLNHRAGMQETVWSSQMKDSA